MRTAAAPEVVVVPEEALYEVVNGQGVERAALSPELHRMASHIGRRLATFVATDGSGTVVASASFVLDRAGELRRRPDVAWVSASRWPLTRLNA